MIAVEVDSGWCCLKIMREGRKIQTKKAFALFIALITTISALPMIAANAEVISSNGYFSNDNSIALIDLPDPNVIEIEIAEDSNDIRNNLSGYYMLST